MDKINKILDPDEEFKKSIKNGNFFGDYDKERALNERKLETFGEFALKSMVRIFM